MPGLYRPSRRPGLLPPSKAPAPVIPGNRRIRRWARYASTMKSGIHFGARRVRLSATRAILTMLLTAFCAVAAEAQSAASIPEDVLIQPDALHHELEARPHAYLVLQVGSRLLFDREHIPGAIYAGPAFKPEGIEALRARVAPLSRSRAIVLYCGCCPWSHCPNIAPAGISCTRWDSPMCASYMLPTTSPLTGSARGMLRSARNNPGRTG